MRIIIPTTITSAMLIASNIPEDDHAAWSSATTYALGATVIAGHGIWKSVQAANTNHDPLTDTTNTWWVRTRATNRWRAFDERIGDQTVGGSSITYSIQVPRTLNRIAFFALAAQSVKIKVTVPGPSVIYDQTFSLSGREPVGNFWEYINIPFAYRVDLIAAPPLPAGATLDITISGGSTTKVGEIIIGRDVEIGTAVTGTSLGIVDYSKKERDDWGGLYIVPRAITRTVNYNFSVPTDGAARVQAIMEQIANKMAVFYVGVGVDTFGATVVGLLRDYDLTLETTRSTGRVEVESLA